MRILLLGLGEAATGNATTLKRIADHLHAAGHQTVFQAIGHLEEAAVSALTQREQCNAALGVHAYGAGKFLRHLPIPTVIVFGGTDLNDVIHDNAKKSVMKEAVEHTAALVCFNEDFMTRAGALWPHVRPKLHLIPQSVKVSPSHFSTTSIAALPQEAIIYLLPAGLREVKAPLFLANTVSTWHGNDPRVHLLIVGTQRDLLYAASVREAVRTLPGVILVDPLPQPDLWALMRRSEAVLNTSRSESSPNSLLEAMALEAPVLARDISGNRAIVSDGKTGMLFATPGEFIARAQELRNDPTLRGHIITNARKMVETEFSPAREAEAYAKLFAELR